MLEAIQLVALKQAIGASSKTANEAVRKDFGLPSLRSRRMAAKLMFLNKMDMQISRYPKILHGKQWKATRAGRQIKSWHKAVSEIASSIGYDVNPEPDLSVKEAGKVLKRVIVENDENQNTLNAEKKSELKLHNLLKERVGFKAYLRGPMTLGKRL